MKLSVQAFLFDLDGVLVDSSWVVESVWHNWAIEHGLDPLDVVASCHGQPSRQTIHRHAPWLDVAEEARAVEQSQAWMVDRLAPCPGALELLDQIPSQHWAVVTSGTRLTARARLEAVGAPVPQVLITADDVVHGKPDPEGYLTAARALQSDPSRCLVIEDSQSGAQAGRLAGCQVLGVNGPLLGRADVDLRVTDLNHVHLTASTTGRYTLCAQTSQPV